MKFRFISLPLIFVLSSPFFAKAVNLIEAEASSNVVAVGDTVSVQVRCTGNVTMRPEIVIKPEAGVRVDPQSALRNFNGTYTFQFVLFGEKVGIYEWFAVDKPSGKQTTPQRLVVRDRTDEEKMNDPVLELNPKRRELFVGEIVPLEISLRLAPRTELLGPNSAPDLAGNGFLWEGVQRRPLRSSNGGISHVYTGEFSSFQSGKLKLGPASFEPIIEIQRNSFGQTKRVKYSVQSDAVELEILPLPSEGRPPEFVGAVGSFEMIGRVESESVQVGDPLVVKLEIDGKGNFSRLGDPSFSDDQNWKRYPPTKTLNRDSRTGLATLFVEQILIPLSPDLKEVPSFRLPYFNPKNRKYEVAETAPLPILVSEAMSKSSSLATTGSDTENNKVAGTPKPKRSNEEIVGIRSGFRQQFRSSPALTMNFAFLKDPLFHSLQLLLGSIAILMLAWLLRNHLKRRAAAQAPPGLREALQAFRAKSGSANQGEYFALAAAVVEAWMRESGSRGASEQSQVYDASRKILGRRDYLHFGGDRSQFDRAVEEGDRLRVERTIQEIAG